MRPQEEWVVSEVEHQPLVSDELFAAAQQRFADRSKRTNGRRNAQASYLLTGMVRCASGHQPLAMYGRKRKQHTYMTCDYGRAYGKEAADQIEGHGQWLYLREDTLLPLIEKFFAERIFGPMRLDKLERQLRTQQRATKRNDATTQQQLTMEIAELDERIARLIDALENGLDATQIRARLSKLQDAKEKAQIDLRTLTPPRLDLDTPDAAQLLTQIPDLTLALQTATPAVKRQLFDAFGLQVTYQRDRQCLELTATISEQLASCLALDGGISNGTPATCPAGSLVVRADVPAGNTSRSRAA